jgi:hypothetical protein
MLLICKIIKETNYISLTFMIIDIIVNHSAIMTMNKNSKRYIFLKIIECNNNLLLLNYYLMKNLYLVFNELY